MRDDVRPPEIFADDEHFRLVGEVEALQIGRTTAERVHDIFAAAVETAFPRDERILFIRFVERGGRRFAFQMLCLLYTSPSPRDS